MAEYYYNQSQRPSNKRRSLRMIILDLVALVVSAVLFVMLALTLVTSFYDPSKSWIFPILGLITPAIYLFSVVMALYWIIRWRWVWATALLLPLAVGAPSISHYAKIETQKSYGQLPRRGVVKVMSYNLKGIINDLGQSSAEPMGEFIELQRPDILCFQEFAGDRMGEGKEPSLLEKYYRAKVQELATFSRYKIIDHSQNLIGELEGNGIAFWSDIVMLGDTIRFYNIHLHSTAITTRDNEYISNMEFLSDSLSDDIFKGMVSRFRTTSIGRAAQADLIAADIATSPYKVVVCGDFNDTPNSYTFRKISNGLQDAFQQVGVGYPHTYRGFMNLLRIDYILYHQPIEALTYDIVDSVLLSDHLPVVTNLKIK